MPEIRVTDEQGTTHVFPDGSTPEMIAQAMNVKPPAAAGDTGAKISAPPAFGTVNWLKQKGWQALETGINLLPGIGATTGAILSAPAALATGPWAPAVITGGAALGGAAGEAAKMSARQGLGWDKPTSVGQTAKQVAIEGGTQGATTALSEMTGVPLGYVKNLSAVNPVERQAIEFGLSRNVPITAGTVGNPFVKSTQKLADYSLGGAMVSAPAKQAEQQAVTRVGGELATEAYPAAAQVPESAGTEVQTSLNNRIADLKQQADTAYDKYRTIVNSPSSVRPVQVGTKTVNSGMVDQFGNPMTQTVPVTQNIATPVDMRQIKQDLQPIYDQMSTWMQPAKRQASAGFQALESIVKGPDYIPASEAEAGLSGLKSLARDATGPNTANVSQGLGKYAAVRLQNNIDTAVYQSGGQDAIDALQAGRALHAQKMEVAETLQSLRDEPVQLFNQLTMAKDAGINKLREVASIAPDDMPKIGRAYIEDMLAKPTAGGGVDNAQGMWSKWQNLGPETKKILFPDAQLRNNLDNFFLLTKKLSENPNPSGTALVGVAGTQLAALGLVLHNPVTNGAYLLSGYGLAKMLRSPSTVRLLLDGMGTQTPQQVIKSSVTRAKVGLAITNILRVAGKDAIPIKNEKDAQQFTPAFASEPVGTPQQ